MHYGLLVPLFCIGLLAVRIRDIALLLGFLFAQYLLFLVFWPELRFLLPVIPFLAIIGGNIIHLQHGSFTRSIKLIPVLAALLLWLVANLLPFHGTGGREAWYTNASAALFAQGNNEQALAMASQATEMHPAYADA